MGVDLRECYPHLNASTPETRPPDVGGTSAVNRLSSRLLSTSIAARQRAKAAPPGPRPPDAEATSPLNRLSSRLMSTPIAARQRANAVPCGLSHAPQRRH